MTMKWRKPPGGRRRLSGNSVSVDTAFYNEADNTKTARALQEPRPVQPDEAPCPLQPNSAENRLERLQQFRQSLDRWHAAGRVDRLPQPADFGLDLPPLALGEVLWRTEARS